VNVAGGFVVGLVGYALAKAWGVETWQVVGVLLVVWLAGGFYSDIRRAVERRRGGRAEFAERMKVAEAAQRERARR
jgi:hypothetical protein